MKKHAHALRGFSHDGASIAKGSTLLDMAPNQFEDWKSVHLVREASAAEVKAARAAAEPAAR
jgi:hypothetical protein